MTNLAPSRTWHPQRRRRSRRRRTDVLAAVAAGGAIGSLGRYGVGLAWPSGDGTIPWSTLAINLVGSLLLGIVLYLVFERRPTNRLLRPFLAVGVLGGFTTFSTFSVQLAQLGHRRPALAIGYLAASLAGGTVAIVAGGAGARLLFARPLDRRARRKETAS